MATTPIPTRRLLAFLALAAGATAVATVADSWAYQYLDYHQIYADNWGRLLRLIGYLPTWLLVGIAFYRIAATPVHRRQALLLMVAPTVAGAASEILKLLVRRARPTAAEGAYVFAAFTDHPFSTGHFGMPSGDATVAFAAAGVLARTWPQVRLLWYSLAVGCALARVMSHAHFLSDVTVAGFLGWGAAAWAWNRYGVTPTTAT